MGFFDFFKKQPAPVTTSFDGTGRIPFPAYKGNEPYIFISYAHADAQKVYKEINKFHQQGYNVWYDEGISPGNEWTDEIAEALAKCALFVVFCTPRSAPSLNVQNEINYAIDEKIPFLAIHLETTNLSPGIKLRIGSRQAILKYNMNENEYSYKYTTAFTRLGLKPGKRSQGTPSAPEPIAPQTPVSSTVAPKPMPVNIPTPTTSTPQTKPTQSTTPPEPIQVNAPAEPVYSLEKIPESAIRFMPRGTAYISLKDGTRHIVTANSLMYQSKASESIGMKNGFIKEEGGVVPFTEIRWYEDEDVWDVDGEKVDIVQDGGQLYFIELEKKKIQVSVKINEVKSIYFDWANVFDSIVYYALLHQVDGPPLVIPAISMLIEIYGIAQYVGPYYNYMTEIPFPNEENIPLKRIKRFEIAAVTHKPSGYDHTCEVEIVIETSNGEILRDKIRKAISLCFLSKKGITSLDLYKIKSYTILEASPERLAATTPAVSAFPSASFSASQLSLVPEIISLSANQIEPFHSEGTVRIVMKDGVEYSAPANAITVRTWDKLFPGLRQNYNQDIPTTEFSSMRRLQATLLPKNPERYVEQFRYEIELRNGSTEYLESDSTSIDFILPDGNASRILPLFDITSMDFNWDTPFSYQPELVTVLKKDGSSVTFPKALFFIGRKVRPSENAAGWFSGKKWENGFINERNQTVQISQLSGVQFLLYRVSKRDFKGYNKWIKECKVEFEYTDGRKEITGLSMDSVHLLGINNHGTLEISGEEIKYIYFG